MALSNMGLPLDQFEPSKRGTALHAKSIWWLQRLNIKNKPQLQSGPVMLLQDKDADGQCAAME